MGAIESRDNAGLSLDLVKDDLLFRIQRTLHLIPADGGDGVLRRAVFFVVIAWLPLVIWALATGHAVSSVDGEPFLRHFSIHARFLVALPVLIFGERLARSTVGALLPRFIAMGLVTPDSVPAFRKVITDTIRLRNSALPWIIIGVVILTLAAIGAVRQGGEEMNWATENGTLGFGGWWYLIVSRPLFQVILLGWLWRVVLLTVLLRRIVGLGLDLVPTHPDKMAGLGFIEGLPRIFGPLAFAAACVLSSRWVHEITYHGAHFPSFRMQAAVFLVLIVLICLAPLWVFTPVLKKAKRRAMAQYGALIASHGRLLHEKWIHGGKIADSSLLDAPELGSAADVNSLHEPIRTMRTMPFGKAAVFSIVIPAAIPMLVAAAMDIPLGELLGKVFKAIF